MAWYIVGYRRGGGMRVMRYPAIDDHTEQIYAAGGQWAETEVLGNRCIVKVRAPVAVLDALDGIYKRLPKERLNDPLSDLPAAAKQALKNEALDMGYTLAELQARFLGDLGDYTLGDVLRFMATRRLKPRYDAKTDEIVLDGPPQACRPVASVDDEVK